MAFDWKFGLLCTPTPTKMGTYSDATARDALHWEGTGWGHATLMASLQAYFKRRREFVCNPRPVPKKRWEYYSNEELSNHLVRSMFYVRFMYRDWHTNRTGGDVPEGWGGLRRGAEDAEKPTAVIAPVKSGGGTSCYLFHPLLLLPHHPLFLLRCSTSFY